MKKVLLPLLVSLYCVGAAHAADKEVYTGPDCSADSDGRLFGGLWDSMIEHPVKYKRYMDDIGDKDTKFKISRLSSEKINKDEAKRLMLRRAKMDGQTLEQIKYGGKETQYLGTDLYRQYYLIESSKGFKAIAQYYSAVASRGTGKVTVSCGADLEDIYIISDTISGHTADFATR